MIELSRHIENLLLENDCVIVPDLGGFIAYDQSAHYEADEGIYYPPTRNVGFNPQLTMNDGVLTQSYMQAYHTDFSDSTRRIALTVEELKETLYGEGRVELKGLGELCYNIQGMYEFHPQKNGFISPSLYGLDAFSMPLLNPLKTEEASINVQQEHDSTVALPIKGKKEIHMSPHWWNHAVAVAVAIILFFALSVPVENTYIDKGNYASLGTGYLFETIRTQSMATVRPIVKEEPQGLKNRNLKPVAVKVEKVAPETDSIESKATPAPKKEAAKNIHKDSPKPAVKKSSPSQAVATGTKKYHLIVASLPTASDAEKLMKDYHQKGYKDATIVIGNDRYRIALCCYSDKPKAYQRLNQLKQEEAFKNAWMLISK